MERSAEDFGAGKTLLDNVEDRTRIAHRPPDFEQYLEGPHREFCERLATGILLLDPDVRERIQQKTINYWYQGRQFGGFEPQQSKILIIPKLLRWQDREDPLGLCEPKHDEELGMGGEIRASFFVGTHEVEYAIDLMRQSLKGLCTHV